VESRGTFHIHHVVSFMVRELRAEPDNLVLLCKKCHLFVHSRKNKTSEFIKELDKVEDDQ
jgi:predicted HNH restriction endonuclease